MKDSEEIKHESFGMAGFSRSSIGGKGINLFGSSILHNQVITFRLHRASVERHLAQDWFHADHRERIVEFTMSQSQFAEMITSMNMGDGVPVTLDYVNGERMADCPHENKRQQHAKEFKNKMSTFASSLEKTKSEIHSIIEKRIPKKDQLDLKHMLDGMLQEIRSNIPFFEQTIPRTNG